MNLIINKKNEALFKYWLIFIIFLVVLMILVGGLTRLTNSGLSITEWELFAGILPPFTDVQWNKYFSLYQKIPQYYLLNSNMTLDEFKTIFLWEYYHRLLGRVIGISFLVPLIYFVYKNTFHYKLKINLYIIFSLIVLQGFIGWYMVSSGLTENVSVSHYRLSLHLLIAFIILSSLFWILVNFNNYKNFFINNVKKINYLKIYIFLIFLQIIIGAFVSGLDAGKVYQSWPLMGDTYFPNDIVVKSFSDLINLNNHSLVQFFHRNLAYLIFFVISFIGFFIFKYKKKYLYKSYMYVYLIILIQITLGILTLVTNLNILIASFHQLSSIFLILFSLNLYHRSLP